MGKLIVGTFLILGFVFYEMSGGSDFAPEGQTERLAAAEITEGTPTPEVTRTSNATLVNVAPEAASEPEAQIVQAAVIEVVEEEIVAEPVAVEATPLDLRFVASSRVNMRSGPGTTHSVLDTLNGGTETEVIEISETGWARVRVIETGQIGWMAERLLTNG